MYSASLGHSASVVSAFHSKLSAAEEEGHPARIRPSRKGFWGFGVI